MLVQKTLAARADGPDPLDYVMSDATVDRLGDIVEPSGWSLASFKKNPIALFGHDSKFIVGKWVDIRVEKGALRGRLELMDAVSDRLKEVHAAVRAGILRAVSVGFRALEAEPMESGGRMFTKSELVECSLVSVPANPNALAVAKSLNLSDDAKALIFGKSADEMDVMRRGLSGESADTSDLKVKKMNVTIAKRIEDAQERLVALRDQLTEHLGEMDDDNPDEAKMAVTEDLNGKIELQERALAQLQQAETRLAATTTASAGKAELARTAGQGHVTVNGQRPFAVPAQKVAPGDLILRSLVAKVVGHATKEPPQKVLVERYGDDGRVDDAQRIVFETVTRAATAPATTTTSGWASQLVETSNAAFLELLMPASVYPGLAARGLRLNFGRSGVISIPSRVATPTIAGSFVLEGSPIPVRQGAFTSITFTPKKMAVISTFTREIAEHSTPAIEGLIRNAIQEDTSVALDTVLLDATAASTTRPAGLRNGVTVTTASAATPGFASLVGDLKALVGALITASSGNLRSPVWIMNPIQALSIATTQNAGGDFPFAQEINNNRFQGYPVILSSTVTAAMVLLVDAADFVAIEGGAPRFDVSDQATLHLEDTTPLAIASGTQGSGVLAVPTRSLYQTDSMALRMIMDVNWGMRRTGVIAWTQSVTW
jgi:HK97 family phage major capsid protein/HK97 family phage prohead protease